MPPRRKAGQPLHTVIPYETLPGFPDISLTDWRLAPQAVERWEDEFPPYEDAEQEFQSRPAKIISPRWRQVPAIQEVDAKAILPAGTRGTKGWLPAMEVMDLPRGHQPFRLSLERPRWRSPGFAPDDSLRGLLDHPDKPQTGATRRRRDRTRPHTRRLRTKCVDTWLEGVPVDLIAQRTQVSRRLINEWIREDLPGRTALWRTPDRLDALQYVGIDEIFWRQQQVAVFVDLATGQLIDLLPSRDQAVIEEALRQLIEVKRRRGQPAWRPVIATDLWIPYREAIQRVFGDQAIHVADRFHVILKMQKGLQDAARQLTSHRAAFYESVPAEVHYKRQKEVQRLVMDCQRQRSRAHRTGQSSNDIRQQEAEALREAGISEAQLPAFQEAIEHAETFNRLWECATPAAAWNHLHSWRTTVTSWGRLRGIKQPFNALMHLLDSEQWAVEVINGLLPEARLPGDRLTTTARVERVNGRLKKLSRWMQDRVNAVATDTERMKEEQQFHRLRARALCHVNLPPRGMLTLHCTLPPEPGSCSCGATMEIVGTSDSPSVLLRDIPLWGAHVIAHCPSVLTRCPQCLSEVVVSPADMDGMTPRMHQYMQERVYRDGTLRSIARETGLSEGKVKRFLERAEQPALPETVPPRLGFVPFTWRRQRRILVTDVDTGQPVDLIKAASASAIAQWLSSCPSTIQWVWLEDPGGLISSDPEKEGLAPTFPLVLDRFTSMRNPQKTLKKSMLRYRWQQSTARRRTPTFRQGMLSYIRNPRTEPKTVQQRLDSEFLRRTLSRHLNDPANALAYALVHKARFLFQDQKQDGTALDTSDLALGTHLWYWSYQIICDRYRPASQASALRIDPAKVLEPVSSWDHFEEFREAFEKALAAARPENERQVAHLLDRLPDIVLGTYGSSTRYGRAAQKGEVLAREEQSLARSRATLVTIRRLRVYGSTDWDRLRLIVQRLDTARHT